MIVYLSLSCKAQQLPRANGIKIAFIADAHFADVFPDLEGENFKGLTKAKGNKKSLIRTMEAQLHSTRLFNENYFALIAALDDAVKRGIKIVALPGDFSDDGQPLHIKGLNNILNSYAKNHGISFFMINGNHDPTRPYGKEGGKQDFLGGNGKALSIMSQEGMSSPNPESGNPTLVLEDLKEWGYSDIVGELGDHGFFPNQGYIYWATPFSSYTYEDYNFSKASEASKLNSRTFLFDDGTTVLPDVSYVVEPIDGLWLLALDANVHVPNKDGKGFSGAGIGYNEVLKHKKHLLEWTQKVAEEANRLGKALIAFSHYPMLDFNDGASEDMKALFGTDAFQAHRIPDEIVGETFADMGLKLHVGGHMHLNDTGTITTQKGNTLVNIQTPSLSAYMPAYKIITVKGQGPLDVETVVLDSVAGYSTFFRQYEREHDFLKSNFPDRMWDKKILASTSYLEYTKTHLDELIRLRFLPNDWPSELSQFLVNLNGWELVVLSNIKGSLSERELESIRVGNMKSLDLNTGNIQKKLKNKGLNESDFTSWNGQNLISDFYRVKNGDELALRELEPTRLECYNFLFKLLLENDKNESVAPLKQFANIFLKQMTGEPSADFSIDLEKGVLSRD